MRRLPAALTAVALSAIALGAPAFGSAEPARAVKVGAGITALILAG
jgi:hypothetical protein